MSEAPSEVTTTRGSPRSSVQVPVLQRGETIPADWLEHGGWLIYVKQVNGEIVVTPTTYMPGNPVGTYHEFQQRHAKTAEELERAIRWAVSYCRRQMFAERRAEELMTTVHKAEELQQHFPARRPAWWPDSTLLWMAGLLVAFVAGFLLGVVVF